MWIPSSMKPSNSLKDMASTSLCATLHKVSSVMVVGFSGGKTSLGTIAVLVSGGKISCLGVVGHGVPQRADAVFESVVVCVTLSFVCWDTSSVATVGELSCMLLSICIMPPQLFQHENPCLYVVNFGPKRTIGGNGLTRGIYATP